MTWKDQVLVADVVVINLTWEMVASNVITRLACVVIKLNAITKIHKYRGFHEGHNLFKWPWRCTTHPSMIWIISSRNVPIFSTIDDQKIIYPYLFAFIFSSNMLVLPFNMFYPLLYGGRLCWCVIPILNVPLLLGIMICMQVTLKGPWVK
jgi:hypothetical protein